MNDDDILFGDFGSDYLNGGRGRDVVHGGTGDEALYGYHNNDWLYGEAGNDRLFGGDNSDRLFGGSGNDQLDGVGGPGVDFLNGGSGHDVFIINYGFSYAVEGGSADQINDWNFAEDRINSNIAGTAGNYTESAGTRRLSSRRGIIFKIRTSRECTASSIIPTIIQDTSSRI